MNTLIESQKINTAKINLANALPKLSLPLAHHQQLAHDLDLLSKAADESELLKDKLSDSEKMVAALNAEIEVLKKKK